MGFYCDIVSDGVGTVHLSGLEVLLLRTVSLLSCYHPQANGQMREPTRRLRASCIMWQLAVLAPGALFFHRWNTCTTRWCFLPPVCPLSWLLFYQLPLFDFQEDEMAFPSVWAKLHHCWTVWKQVRSALTCSSLQSQGQANRHSTPAYRAGQKA